MFRHSLDDGADGVGAARVSSLMQSAAELEALATRHRRLLEEMGGTPPTGSGCMPCGCRDDLHEMLVECIQVIEETRSSFKSRRLAALRHKLIQILTASGMRE